MSEKIIGTPPIALVIGASSGIGRALTIELVKNGYVVSVVARREKELQELAQECNAGHSQSVVFPYPHDVLNTQEVPALFQKICDERKGLDLVVYSSGIMPNIGDNEFSTQKDLSMIDINVSGAVAWLNEAAQRFSQIGAGKIVGIGSVAGDRGRRKGPVYGATKAFLEHYLESLRNRLTVKGVSVITIKPGPTITPMTEGLSAPMLFPVEKSAEQIMKAIQHNCSTAYVPRRWRGIMWVVRNIPGILFRRLNF